MILLYYILSATVSVLSGHFVIGMASTTALALFLHHFFAYDGQLVECVSGVSGTLLAVHLKEEESGLLVVLAGNVLVYLFLAWALVGKSTDGRLIVTFALAAMTGRARKRVGEWLVGYLKNAVNVDEL